MDYGARFSDEEKRRNREADRSLAIIFAILAGGKSKEGQARKDRAEMTA